jgi:hypothetical protein
MKEKVRTFIRSGKMEAWTWLIAIALLAMTDPDSCGHFTLCLFKNLGFDFCPGCGLGHGIALLFRGRLADSWAAHPLAIPAVIILLYRSYTLFAKKKFPLQQTNNNLNK